MANKKTKEKVKGTIEPKKGLSYYINKLLFFLYKKKGCKKCNQ